MFSFLERIVGKSDAKPGTEEPLFYVLGFKFTTHSRAEQMDFKEVEDAIRDAALPGIVLDKIENGTNEVAFWFHATNAKRAFKQLSELPPIANRLNTLQAAFAERTTLKFSILWPKGGKAAAPRGLG